MTGERFNQIPVQCQGLCELDQEDVDKHGIVLTRNCGGPSLAGDAFKDSTRVSNGEIVSIDEIEGRSLGRLACRNRGAFDWLNAKQQQFKELENRT